MVNIIEQSYISKNESRYVSAVNQTDTAVQFKLHPFSEE